MERKRIGVPVFNSNVALPLFAVIQSIQLPPKFSFPQIIAYEGQGEAKGTANRRAETWSVGRFIHPLDRSTVPSAEQDREVGPTEVTSASHEGRELWKEKSKFYAYHKAYGYATDRCKELGQAIEKLIQQEHLKGFMQGG
ncbi:hypothetical protein CDL15_Pgr026513 [Punica granatum]|nr:hypothetical protein CDL15_Pgr026513 [Punica granatum]